MDAFQGCYKNGTDGTRDCRYFSALYLMVRISFFIMFAVTLSSSVIIACFIVGVIFTAFAIFLAIAQPYKSPLYNAVDTVLVLSVALVYFCIVAKTIVIVKVDKKNFETLMGFMFSVLLPVPFIYMTVVVLYRLFFRHTKMAALVLKIRSALRRSNSEESLMLPDRLTNPEECAALLRDPMDVGQSNNNVNDVPSLAY